MTFTRRFLVVLVALVATAAPLLAGGAVQTPGAGTGVQVNRVGFPIVNEPLTLNFLGRRAPVHGPWEEMLVFNEYEKMTGITIDWEAVPDSGYRERLNLILASGDLPDAIVRAGLSPTDVATYGPQGVFVPLEDLVADWAPNLDHLFNEHPAALSSSLATDGHMYALPAFVTLEAARTEKHWINRIWLEKLGLQVPTTFDEFRRVLIAFRDTDPNGNGRKDEIPMTARGFANGGFANIIQNYMGAFGVQSQFGFWVTIDDGRANVWVDDARFRQLLEIWAGFYRDGLLDVDFVSQTQPQWLAKHNPQIVGYFANQADDTFTPYAQDFIGIAPFAGPTGLRGKNNSPVARDFGTFAIMNTNEHPEATIRWIDYFYGQEGSRFFRMGPEGETHYRNDSGQYVYIDSIMQDPRGTGAAIGQMTIWPQGGAPHLINDENSIAINSATTSRAQVALQPYLDNPVYGVPIFSPEAQREVVAIRTDLEAYVLENTARFITGAQTFAQWNDYVAGLQRIGIARLEQLYQEVYDRIAD